MKRHLWKLLSLALLVALVWAMRPPPKHPLHMEHSTSQEPVFLLHQIGTDHSEGIAAMDMNGDGRLDVTSGLIGMRPPAGSAAKNARRSSTASSPLT